MSDSWIDVSVDFNGVEFLGPLAFINTLSDVIPLDGFSDPPNLSITPSGIEVGYSLGLPVVGVGLFSYAGRVTWGVGADAGRVRGL